jgi:hypothetical protein
MNLGMLKKSGEALLAESARAGIRQSTQLAALVLPFGRQIDLLPLTEVIDQAMRDYDPNDKSQRTESDAWIGPRLHAALRLTRAEAADDAVWIFLAAYAFPDYVIWRWPAATESFNERVYGSDLKKQAFKRLWWTTELFRNGADYTSAERALSQSDISNTLTAIDAVHSRAVALCLVDFLQLNELTSRQVNGLGKQLNSSAVTVAVDRAYVTQDEAVELDESWIRATPDLQEVLNAPIGPRHGRVDQADIDNVLKALTNIIDLNVVRNYRKTEQN